LDRSRWSGWLALASATAISTTSTGSCRYPHSPGPGLATKEPQRIAGIGPFYAALIVVRAAGFTVVFLPEESRVLSLAGELYFDGEALTIKQSATITDEWCPFRTWATVLIRSTGEVLLSPR
jgi:DNA-3-methyladenine glycosylase II